MPHLPADRLHNPTLTAASPRPRHWPARRLRRCAVLAVGFWGALLSGGCLKATPEPVPQLPAATQTGQNTAGCLVDGQVWLPLLIPSIISTSPKPIFVKYQVDGSGSPMLSIELKRYDEKRQADSQTEVDLLVLNVLDVGTFDLNQPINPATFFSSRPPHAQYNVRSTTPSSNYLTGPAAVGQVVVTRLDKSARIVSGTFEFTALDPQSNRRVEVRDGRFDLKYQ